MTLAECLGMTRHLADILHLCPGNTQQILMDFKFINTVDIERSREDEVNGLSHFTGIAILNRQHRHITLALKNRIICCLEISARNPVALRKDASRRNMSKCAFHAAVCNLEAALQAVLICAGNRHHVLQMVDVVSPEKIIFNEGRISFDNQRFPLFIQNR